MDFGTAGSPQISRPVAFLERTITLEFQAATAFDVPLTRIGGRGNEADPPLARARAFFPSGPRASIPLPVPGPVS